MLLTLDAPWSPSQPLVPYPVTLLFILHHTWDCWILHISWLVCWLSASSMSFVLYRAVSFPPGLTCESWCPHLSHDYNKTSLGVKRPRRRHNKFLIRTTIIETRQSGWGILRLPRTPHTTSAHKRVRSTVEIIAVANFASFSKFLERERVQIRGYKYESKGSVWGVSWAGRKQVASPSLPHSSHPSPTLLVISWDCIRPPLEGGHVVSQPVFAAGCLGHQCSHHSTLPSCHTPLQGAADNTRSTTRWASPSSQYLQTG